ncbi:MULTISPECIES: ParA family protein [Romboutsia]|uniref:Sporulation initiation inhibitor protein Soj n=1 Tax=Romboutsia hominis TaxID=1507512 RepID=A0A2P2BVB1_9FIRM|nr:MULTISPECIES: AAA family ATPase [Romboutsia]MCH1958870.1 AAA family ATPase [Romboutsia hominis]MCH1967997.1 AAA family ATPase [Romboutsia hominis]MDB8794023.1 AAA family ATPase [Romboutsia sp. 1001216sp1]MDB8796950.1 AAA family ATPase [Romboutsia sp. 1001216sp1]MDB8800405.1 AAA family ATPase [Romboutsia sp. 1001216sp1]
MGKVIAVFNQKGGVGKTTTNVNLSASIGKMGKKVLVLDLDPQGNTTSGYGIEKQEVENTIYEVMLDGVDIREAILPTEFDNVDTIASATELSGAEIELTNMDKREYVLKNAIECVRKDYDYIFIDCPPSLGMLTINCLTAVDSVLIPIQCEYYALEGVSQLMETIKLVKSRLNPHIEIQGVVLSMFDGRANLSIQVVEEVKRYFKGSVYTTLIPRNVRLAEAPSHGKPVIYYDARCRGAEAYMDLAEEFIDLEEDII